MVLTAIKRRLPPNIKRRLRAALEMQDVMRQYVRDANPLPVNKTAYPLDAKMLDGSPAYIERFVLELTDRCNLRCIYCHQNLPDFKSERDISDGSFEELLAYVRKYKLPMADLTGAGDLLMAPGWQEKCERLLETGIELHTTVNLGKMLNEAEINTLSRFTYITVSIDSVHKEILQKVRKSVDVRTIIYNMMRIKAAAMANKRTQLKWVVSAVYSAEIVEQLPDLAAFAVAFGAHAFGIQDLVEYGYIEKNVTNVWNLKGEEAVNASVATKKAIEYARASGLAVHVATTLESRLDELETKAYVQERPEEKKKEEKLEAGAGDQFYQRTTYVDRPKEGYTRDCNDPWTFMQILGDGRVRPCCFSGVEMGKVGEDGTLNEVRNSVDARKLREELLTGKLDDYCAACNFRSAVPVAEFQRKMLHFFDRKEQEARRKNIETQ